jgi:hypothetical protein
MLKAMETFKLTVWMESENEFVINIVIHLIDVGIGMMEQIVLQFPIEHCSTYHI